MGFSINPNKYLYKTLKVIESCDSLLQLDTASKCVELYDNLEQYIYDYFDNTDDFPHAHHMGHYDHQLAMYVLLNELEKKKEAL